MRVEIQVPAVAAEDLKFVGQRRQHAYRRAEGAKAQIEFILGTINALRPHPYPIDAKLVRYLTDSRPDAHWLRDRRRSDRARPDDPLRQCR